MGIRVAGRLAIIFVFLPLLSACGDMNSMFTPNNNYHVMATINGVSLETSSIIRSGDKISPSFVISVGNDPDLTGLLVYLRNSQGELVGNRIRYVIGIPASEPSESEDLEDAGDVEEDEPPEESPWDLPPEVEPMARWAFTGNQHETDDSVVEIVVRSFDEELPHIPLPENMEIGPHHLIFEVLGGRVTLRRMEIPVFYLADAELILRDISVSLPGLFDTRLVPPGIKVLLEARLDFDSRLDPYLIWRSGRNIIREGRVSEGAGSILWETPRQAAFHPLRLEVLPFRVRGNFAGISREILLPVSPNAENAGFFFGTGQGHPAQNRLAQGIFHLDRQVHAIDAEGNGTDTEDVLELPELRRWYQFKGRLYDTISDQDEGRFLMPVGANPPRWTSMGHIYGLSTSDDDAFLLSSVNFFQGEQEHGGGIFLFHIRPVADGTIFSVFFPSHSSASGGAWIDMSRSGNAIVLRIGTAEATVEMQMFLSYFELRDLLPVAVKFYIHPDRLEANLSVGENAFLQSTVHAVELFDALTGEGLVRLGGAPLNSWSETPAQVFAELAIRADTLAWEATAAAIDNVADVPPYSGEWERPEGWDESAESEEDTESPFQPEMEMETEAETALPGVTTIWNEFAIMLSSLPFPQPVDETDDAEEYDDEHLDEGLIAETQDNEPEASLAMIIPEALPDTEPQFDATENLTLENGNQPADTQTENGSMAQDIVEIDPQETEPGVS